MLVRIASALVCVAIAAGLGGCTAQTSDEDPTTGEGDGDDDSDTVESALTSGCALSRAKILASVSGGRATAIRRGFVWLDNDVPYSQVKSYAGYRTDCSGFVSMCWQLGTSYSTLNFINGTGDNEMLSSFNELVPGDALVRRANGKGHIVMFLGWDNAAKSSACVLEQASTALDMQFRARTVSSLRASGYKAIRADKF